MYVYHVYVRVCMSLVGPGYRNLASAQMQYHLHIKISGK